MKQASLSLAAMRQGLLWVLADHSQHAAPHIWAETVRHLYRQWRAEAVIAEVNQGGDLISAVLQTAQPPLALKTVRAMQDKASRALPIAAAYQRGAIFYGAPLPNLSIRWSPLPRPAARNRLTGLMRLSGPYRPYCAARKVPATSCFSNPYLPLGSEREISQCMMILPCQITPMPKWQLIWR